MSGGERHTRHYSKFASPPTSARSLSFTRSLLHATMRGWVQVEPPEGASTDDEYYFAPSLFRAHNARERLAMLAGVPATEQRDSALLAQLQGASLSQGVSVGASLPQGAPIPTAEFSSLGLSSLRAGAAPTGRAPSDRTRTERREREEVRTACICSAPPCICWEGSADQADTWRARGAEGPMEPMEPSSVEALSLEATPHSNPHPNPHPNPCLAARHRRTHPAWRRHRDRARGQAPPVRG